MSGWASLSCVCQYNPETVLRTEYRDTVAKCISVWNFVAQIFWFATPTRTLGFRDFLNYRTKPQNHPWWWVSHPHHSCAISTNLQHAATSGLEKWGKSCKFHPQSCFFEQPITEKKQTSCCEDIILKIIRLQDHKATCTGIGYKLHLLFKHPPTSPVQALRDRRRTALTDVGPLAEHYWTVRLMLVRTISGAVCNLGYL